MTRSVTARASMAPMPARNARPRRWIVAAVVVVLAIVSVTAIVVVRDRSMSGPCEAIPVSVVPTPPTTTATVEPQKVLVAERVAASGMAGPGWDGPFVVIMDDGTAVALSSFTEADGARFRRATLPIEAVEQIRACVRSEGFRSLESEKNSIGSTTPRGGSCLVADQSTFTVWAGPASGNEGVVRTGDLDGRATPPCARPAAFTEISDALARTQRLVMTQGELTDAPPPSLVPR